MAHRHHGCLVADCLFRGTDTRGTLDHHLTMHGTVSEGELRAYLRLANLRS